MSRPYPRIGDYALIGDCHTAALIARDASVDWFCPRRFDAPAVFCRVLDSERGGYFQTIPTGDYAVERRYRGPTNVLETTFSTDRGRVRITDLMPIHQRKSDRRGYDAGTSHRLLRRLECLHGELEIRLEFKPTFNFARADTRIDVRENGAIATADEAYLTLACTHTCHFRCEDGTVRASLRLAADQAAWVVLTCAEDPDRAEEALAPVNCDQQLERTLQYWHDWVDKCTYHGAYRDLVLRSALVLKLLTYEPTGAVVAAPTTSLPESVGGERNWDYRFTWLRDASLILYVLQTIGYGDEAADFTHWLEQTIGSDPTRRPQIMYSVDGRQRLPEECLDHMSGYRGSRPVRVGNAAAEQRQLDIFGEVLRAAALHYHRDSDTARTARSAADALRKPVSDEAWSLLRELVERAADHWNEDGNGIWEVRAGPQPFLYGKLMCWAALDSGIRLAQEFHLDAPKERWRKTRDQIRSAILQHGYDPKTGAFTQAFGSSVLDATALVIPRIGFLPPTDSRVQSTVDRIRHHLSKDGLVYRYRTRDGLAAGEGTFTLCTFWLVDALALGGRLDEARTLFEHTLGYASDLGLFAEEIDPANREQLGNFPQGFSHLALIGAAVSLTKAAAHGSENEPETESERASRASGAVHFCQ